MKAWTDYWTGVLIVGIIAIAIPDVWAVIQGHRQGVGDKYTFTHFLVTRVGLSVLGAFIGYLIVHFLIQHRNG